MRLLQRIKKPPAGNEEEEELMLEVKKHALFKW